MKKYKIKMFKKKLLRPYYAIKHAYQRVTRGFSDNDAWNADKFLAAQLSGILMWFVNEGHGVPMSYAREDDLYGQDTEYMTAARDAEYKKYAAMFEEYGKHGHAVNDKWKSMFGGLTDAEVHDMMTWLAEHFTELWD